MGRFPKARRLPNVAGRGATVILLVLAAATLLVPRSVERLTGVRAEPELASPDDLPPLSKEDVTPFFRSRNGVEIHVREATTLREFLDRNRLNKPFHRQQIVKQLGNDGPNAQIAAGTVFRIALTPEAVDVPGARTSTAADESP
jgi:hypothetical protein